MIHSDGTRVLERCERCWEPECGGDCGFSVKHVATAAECDGYPSLVDVTAMGDAEPRYLPGECCGDPGDCGTCGR